MAQKRKSTTAGTFETSLGQADKVMVGRLLETFDTLIPDTEDYSNVLVDQVQHTFICTYYCLSHIKNPEQKIAEHALQKVSEAIDILGYESGDSEAVALEKKKWNEELLEYSRKHTPLSAGNLSALRNLNQSHLIPVV
ncbi:MULTISPECIES: hypothetical protein [Pseudomonas]|uniref:hypothetical protein n=1 Tax=Pseudomonas TaxID=286 RepID=UPI0011AF0829|nr:MULTISPECIES: hypothetical protein [Pseudomonas]